VALWYLALSGSPPGSRRLIGPLLIGLGATLFSTLVILPFHPGLTPEAERMYSDAGWREIGLMLGVLIAVPVEEVVFRGVIQGWLETRARRRGWGPAVPVVLAALLWTCGHAGLVEPQGIKEIQIFVLGLVFGWARLRWGLLGAVVAHGVLNSYACISQIVLWIQ
jgi:membrane protease YdiL (CAAX protease family)